MSFIYDGYLSLLERNKYYMILSWFQIWTAIAYLSYFLPWKFGLEMSTRDLISKISVILHGIVILIASYAELFNEGIRYGEQLTQFQIFLFEIS